VNSAVNIVNIDLVSHHLPDVGPRALTARRNESIPHTIQTIALGESRLSQHIDSFALSRHWFIKMVALWVLFVETIQLIPWNKEKFQLEPYHLQYIVNRSVATH
jgi:hypothetical protein